MVYNEASVAVHESSPLVIPDGSPAVIVGPVSGARRRRRPQEKEENEEPAGSCHKKWIMLAMFCSLAFVQNSVFVEWNPIARSAECAFHPSWTDGTFAWQVNLATVTSPVTQWPIWWAIQKFGLSPTVRWGAVFPLLLSSALSAIPLAFSTVSGQHFKMFTYAASVFTGITGAVYFSSITRFSMLWFPAEQRATATGLSITFANMGTLLPALVGPLIVSDPPKADDCSNSTRVHDQVLGDQIRREIFHYLLIYFVICIVMFVSYLTYFPMEARLSPTRRQRQVEDVDEEVQLGDSRVVLGNFLKLLRNPAVMFIMVLYSFSTLPIIWGLNLLTVTLSPLNISQKAIGALIIISTLTSFLTTVVASRLADLFFRFRLKTLILLILPLHAASMIGFGVSALAPGAESDSNQYLVFVFYAAGISFLNSCAPLIYELVSEMSYPVPEDIVCGLTNQFSNVFGAMFYLVFSQMSYYAGKDYAWLLYMLMFVPIFVTVLFLGVKERYQRSDATSLGFMVQSITTEENITELTDESADRCQTGQPGQKH